MKSLTRPKEKYLYKYSSEKAIQYLEPLLLKNELFFPRPSQLNDPAEGKPRLSKPSRNRLITFLIRLHYPSFPYEALDSELIKYGMQISYYVDKFGIDLLHKEMTKILHEDLDERHRIYSLSRRWNNMSLWAKYADNHRGYCLEFANQGIFEASYEVQYGDTVDAIEIMSKDTINALFFFSKKLDWLSEEEVRIVTPSTVKMPLQIPPQTLTGIILGKDMSSKNEDTIKKWCAKRITKLKVFKAEYDVLIQELKRHEMDALS